MNFGLVAYGAATAAFLLLSALLAAGRQGRQRAGYLLAAAVLTCLWAALLACQTVASSVSFASIYLVEIVRGGAWLAALVALAGPALPRWLGIGSNLLWVGLLAVLAVLSTTPAGNSVDSRLVFTRGALAVAVVGMILLEQLYRNAGPGARPALKYLLLGVGGLFAYDIFLYSQAELLQGIEREAWHVRGLANALCVPLIILAVRRSADNRSSIFISRHVVFHTTAMIGVGGYLLLMALGGYYVRSMGGSWGRLAEILFLFASLAVLGLLVFSTQLRRRLSVFIAKHFFRNKYDYRLEWLRFIRTLSANTEGEVKRTAVRAVTQIFDSPAGMLLTTDEQGRAYTPAAAWPASLEPLPAAAELSADGELIAFLKRRQWIVDLREYDRTPELYDNIAIPDWIRGLTSVRIISPMMELDRLTGIFLLDSPPEPFSLTYEDRDLLKMVGQHVATQLGQHEADRKLAESRQFETYNKLTAFMMHDLKNCAAQLHLLVTNAERHKHNPDFIEDAFSTVANAAQRMTRLIEHLERKEDRPQLRAVVLATLTEAAISRCSDRFPVPVATSLDTSAVVMADTQRLEAIIEHVIRNAQDASTGQETVEVALHVAGNEVNLTVSDRGPGMTATFVRERLFRPFDSTKGAKGMGIGAYQTREYVRMLGGDVKVQSSPGNGTTFSIILPCLTGPRAPEVSRARQAPEDSREESVEAEQPVTPR